MDLILGNWGSLPWFSGLLVSAVLAALVFHYLIFKILTVLSKRTTNVIDDSIKKHFRWPLRWLIILIFVRLVLPFLYIPARILVGLQHVFGLILIALVSWILIRIMYVFKDYVLSRFDVGTKDNLKARKIHTQLNVLRRIVTIVVFIIAFSAMLMTFEKARQLGTAILASAGIVGVVVGFAAQKTIGTFIAGLQIAFTQPIRVDDVVIVENEWGRIEEITLTYVVVRVWDLRRLIVPITYFIEKPFQNWTRTTADILGTVYIYVDYTVPVEEIRAQLKHILENSQLWDNKVCGLQVTNTTEHTIEIRALMSAANASAAWDLRCEVREKLIGFIQQHYPQALPKTRIELDDKHKSTTTV